MRPDRFGLHPADFRAYQCCTVPWVLGVRFHRSLEGEHRCDTKSGATILMHLDLGGFPRLVMRTMHGKPEVCGLVKP